MKGVGFRLRGAEALWAADGWLRGMLVAGHFLSEQEDFQRCVLGELFVVSYLKLAAQSEAAGVHRWRCRPKFHLMHHICVDRLSSRQNPAAYSCWMDEDCVKRMIRLSKMVHKRTATVAALQRWQLGLPAQLRKFLE